MNENYPPGFTYQDFARDFRFCLMNLKMITFNLLLNSNLLLFCLLFCRLEFFNATEWVKLFEQSGAKYAVLTSKHHEGFTLWPSPHSFSWNSVDVSRYKSTGCPIILGRNTLKFILVL
jgi:alpha-L-fucosidase